MTTGTLPRFLPHPWTDLRHAPTQGDRRVRRFPEVGLKIGTDFCVAPPPAYGGDIRPHGSLFQFLEYAAGNGALEAGRYLLKILSQGAPPA